jgi:hypothetical protein
MAQNVLEILAGVLVTGEEQGDGRLGAAGEDAGGEDPGAGSRGGAVLRGPDPGPVRGAGWCRA